MIFNINIFNIYTLISPVNVSNIGHIRNIGSDIGQYYRVNIVSDTSKSDIILPIYIWIGWYLKPCSFLALFLMYVQCP